VKDLELNIYSHAVITGIHSNHTYDVAYDVRGSTQLPTCSV
jgi:hypothetical protein